MKLEARSKRWGRGAGRWLPAILLATTTLVGEAGATDAAIAVGEVAPPPAGAGIDAAALRDAAAAEIKQIDASRLPGRRKVVVSLAVTRAQAAATIACTVNAMVRDARTGVMLAIIEGGAEAQGPASEEVRGRVARAAVRSAVRRIPNALGAK
jgi:hypothetical protein